jgi:hypothetical protein
MAKHAGFALAWECYLGELAGSRSPSPLAGSRLWAFLHDEWILEVPETRAPDCAVRVVEIMEEASRVWCPDVPARAEPALSRSWRKAATAVYDGGRLIPYEDRPMTDDERSRIRADERDPVRVSWDYGRTADAVREVIQCWKR